MATIYEYILKLNSKMDGIVAANKGLQRTDQLAHQAQASANRLGGAFSKMGGILGTMGIGFGMFQVVNLMEKGIEKAHILHLAQAQIQAGLISTGNAAGMTMQSIDAIATKISDHSLSSRADILSMQSILLTFPNVSKQTFGSASQAITDMSTRMKTDLSSTALQVGKALQDPILGITALRRAGVNFNGEQKEMIKNLVKGGNMAAAQTMILTELNKEFGGSAQAAYDATPLAKYNKVVGKIQTMIGELGLKIQEKLAPHLEGIATKFKAIVKFGIEVGKWMYNHKALVLGLAVAFGVLTVAINYNTIVTKLSAAWTSVAAFATAAWTAITWLFSAALWTCPITWIVVGIIALITIIGLVIAKTQGWGQQWDHVVGMMKSGISVFANEFMKEIDKIQVGWYKFKNLMGIGDKTENNKLISQLNGDVELRKKAIAGATAQFKDNSKWDITWKTEEKKKKTGTENGGILAAVFPGLNGAGTGTGGGSKATKAATEKVATGGTRNTSITINLGKMVESIIFQGGVKENEKDLVSQVEAALLRVLYSAQSAS